MSVTSILPLSIGINVTVALPGATLQPFAINNLCLISSETLTTQGLANLAAGPGYLVYNSLSAVQVDWGANSETYAAVSEILDQPFNPLSGNGVVLVYPQQVPGTDTFTTSINQLLNLTSAGGFIPVGFQPSYADYISAGNAAQNTDLSVNAPAGFIVVAPTPLLTDVTTSYTATPPGLGSLALQQGLTRLRVVYYGGTFPQFPVANTAGAAAARVFAAAYAGRGFSTNFNGVATCQTLNWKQLEGVSADPTITTTIWASAQANGVDVYANVGGPNLPKILCSNGAGAGDWFDNVYNLLWFQNGIQVAAYNSLASTQTKIPQTEAGMTVFKRPLRNFCAQAVQVGFLAPGTWTLPETIGVPDVCESNIEQYGYYLYSLPVSEQSTAARLARTAPLTQIAIKYAGAIQSASIVINVNF
jgi:hypothetical protein